MNQQEKKVETIVVNGRPQNWAEKEITFDQLVALAYPNPPQGGNIEYTISYRRAHGNKPQGTLKAGESVKVNDGMIFDVTATDLS
ncbi:multiubiquitin domain-containing protein [Aeromicrobium sp. NPDC092404]|uniref:multiubiquitin domain-containing protein n=1 Tax=Aeromicrobium sp. NPDC092404 TaxID=3154976 RepID=UPI0034460BAD